VSYTSLTEKTVKKGRRDHRCIWCNEIIPKGSEHIYRAYIFDNEFQTDRMHGECFGVMGDADDFDEGFMPGEFNRGQSNRRAGM